VIFTGSVPLDEFRYDRPAEYAQVVASREIDERIVDPPPEWFVKLARVFGFTCLGIGLFIILLIIYSSLFIYR
jgi:hypothetical protein